MILEYCFTSRENLGKKKSGTLPHIYGKSKNILAYTSMGNPKKISSLCDTARRIRKQFWGTVTHIR
jgi:hypothetical protein